MALERKPVEDPQEPGYPSSNEYVTGRRAFLGLLGLTALGVGGVYLLKGSSDPTADRKLGALRAPTRTPSGPQGQIGGVVVAPRARPNGDAQVDVTPQPVTQDTPVPVTPAQPQAESEGTVRVVAKPKPPAAKPIAPTPGVPPPPKDDPPKAPAPDAPRQPAQPVVPALGVTAPVPVRPQAVISGEPGPPPPSR